MAQGDGAIERETPIEEESGAERRLPGSAAGVAGEGRGQAERGIVAGRQTTPGVADRAAESGRAVSSSSKVRMSASTVSTCRNAVL